MKIGILTLPLHTNYGGILQAYALQTVLERLGHEVEILDCQYLVCRPWWRNTLTLIKRLFMRTSGKHVALNFQKEYNSRESAKRKYVNIFIQKYTHRRVLTEYGEISPNDYDAIVVGSDQIWRKKYLPNENVAIPFLSFTTGWKIKKIAYAASFGTDVWEFSLKDTNIAKQAILKFDAVSVREDSGVVLCQHYLDYRKAVQVLDPTLLLKRKDYEQIIDNSSETKHVDGNLMLYVLNYTEDKHHYIKECAKMLGMRPFETNSKYEVEGASLDEIVQLPVEQWLRSFREAEFVITDSFHACVFSILFHKPFIAIGNTSRGLARFQSLLSLFGLEDRLITDDFDVDLCKNKIEWVKVDAVLLKLRNESLNFLSHSLAL